MIASPAPGAAMTDGLIAAMRSSASLAAESVTGVDAPDGVATEKRTELDIEFVIAIGVARTSSGRTTVGPAGSGCGVGVPPEPLPSPVPPPSEAQLTPAGTE